MLVAAVFAVGFAPAPASPTGQADAQVFGPATDLGCTATGFLLGGDVCDGSVADPEEQTALSIYQAALQTDSSNNQYFDLLNNQLETSEEVAWMRAERAAARAATNGTTETAANIDVTESLNDYYSIHKSNLLDKWNLLLTGFESYRSQASNVSYDAFTHERIVQFNLDADQQGYVDSVSYQGLGSTNRTLANGTTREVKTVTYDVTLTFGDDELNDDSTVSKTITAVPWKEQYRISDSYTGASADFEPNYIQLQPPTSDYDAHNYHSFERMRYHWDRIENQRTNLTTETETWLSNVYPALDSGQVNPEDLVSNVNRMFNYAVEGGENATYSEAFIALASLGLDPAGNSSYLSLTYEHDGAAGNVTHDGMLLSDTAPGGSWEVGTVYDSANISGPQMVVTLDGEEHTINGTFEINGAYRDDGTEISNPTLDAPGNDYEVSNTTETQELIQTLTEQINRYENMTTDTAGGGGVGGVGGLGGLGGFFGGLADSVKNLIGLPWRLVILLAGALLLAVVVLR